MSSGSVCIALLFVIMLTKNRRHIMTDEKEPSKRKATEKWGKEVMELNYSIVPSLLLKAQARLGINPTELAIILHLADFWWDKHNNPYPAKSTLADRLGISPRQVQRHIARLEESGFVRREERVAVHQGKLSNLPLNLKKHQKKQEK
jgi:DNA-binding transcriptional ArsR family regulator